VVVTRGGHRCGVSGVPWIGRHVAAEDLDLEAPHRLVVVRRGGPGCARRRCVVPEDLVLNSDHRLRRGNSPHHRPSGSPVVVDVSGGVRSGPRRRRAAEDLVLDAHLRLRGRLQVGLAVVVLGGARGSAQRGRRLAEDPVLNALLGLCVQPRRGFPDHDGSVVPGCGLRKLREVEDLVLDAPL
jgi:hypothetical protein